tara:strand:- start:159 stop:560 length:402 start_codon:yes stop_codon:yes gene_type:complete
MKLLIENFKNFLNEDSIPWPKLLKLAASSYEQAKSLGESIGIENFDEEFLLKLADNWEEPIEEDSDVEYMELYWDHYALGDGLDPENIMAIQKLAADKASEYGKKLEGLPVRQGRDYMMYRKFNQLRKELTFK